MGRIAFETSSNGVPTNGRWIEEQFSLNIHIKSRYLCEHSLFYHIKSELGTQIFVNGM